MKKKVLVIDDNEQNLYLMTFLLESKGYEVITAIDGIKGIKKAIEKKPDLILLDIQLPELDGYEVAERIKNIDEISHIPIVAVTSYAMPADEEKALAIGCVGYIKKPFFPENFIPEIEKYLFEK